MRRSLLPRSFFDNLNDPTKEAHFNLAVDLINDHTDGFHDDLLVGTMLETMVVSSNCNSITAAQGFWDAWRDWGRPLHGVVGARCSSASMAVAQIAGLDKRMKAADEDDDSLSSASDGEESD